MLPIHSVISYPLKLRRTPLLKHPAAARKETMVQHVGTLRPDPSNQIPVNMECGDGVTFKKKKASCIKLSPDPHETFGSSPDSWRSRQPSPAKDQAHCPATQLRYPQASVMWQLRLWDDENAPFCLPPNASSHILFWFLVSWLILKVQQRWQEAKACHYEHPTEGRTLPTFLPRIYYNAGNFMAVWKETCCTGINSHCESFQITKATFKTPF